MTRPLDHLVLPTADLAVARERLEALGLTVAPEGVHPFGTRNCCVYFSDGTFLEPLAVADPAGAAKAVADGNVFVSRDALFRSLNGQDGFSAVVIGSDDAEADHVRFIAAGISAGPRLDFSRPFVDASGRSDAASFRLAFATMRDTADAFVFTCERANVPKVDRTALERHTNGTVRIKGIVAAATAPERAAAFLARAAGVEPNETTVDLGNAAVSVLSPVEAERLTGAGPGESELRFVAVAFVAHSLATTAQLFMERRIVHERRGGRLSVPPAPGQGATFIFEEQT